LYKIPAGTLFLGKNLLILPECTSTNTLAAELSQAGEAAEGTVVITHHQTAGRGQRGNTWQSGKGLNLTLSIVLQPTFLSAIRQFQLNKAVALAVRDVVSKYTDEAVCVKWPNDIMIGDKKVCGILIENQLTGDKLGRSIVGIGLNVNQSDFESPLASSVSLHSGKSIDLPQMFEELLQSLEWRYLQVRSQESGVRSKESGARSQESGARNQESGARSQESGARSQETLDDDYLRALYRIHESHRYVVDSEEMKGIIRNVDQNGKLIVEINNSSRSFDLKEIKFVY
jgi:BirA family biotin operon repressor/biotin-[acetyl-CoA-carboxylase] ligase